jgi:hypothetical protein
VSNLPEQSGPPVDGIIAGPASVPFWDDTLLTLEMGAEVSAWDQVLIAGLALPGLCTVRSKKHKRIDIQKKKGTDTARMVFTGYDPGEIVVSVRIWTKAQLAQLQQIIPVIRPKTDGKSLKALDIYHPSLALVGIHSVVVDTIDTLEPTPVKGIWQMAIHCLEYNKPSDKDVTATVSGSANLANVPHAIQADPNTILQTPPSETDTGPDPLLPPIPVP